MSGVKNTPVLRGATMLCHDSNLSVLSKSVVLSKSCSSHANYRLHLDLDIKDLMSERECNF